MTAQAHEPLLVCPRDACITEPSFLAGPPRGRGAGGGAMIDDEAPTPRPFQVDPRLLRRTEPASTAPASTRTTAPLPAPPFAPYIDGRDGRSTQSEERP